jgi:hypothetical protein
MTSWQLATFGAEFAGGGWNCAEIQSELCVLHVATGEGIVGGVGAMSAAASDAGNTAARLPTSAADAAAATNRRTMANPLWL